MSAWSWAVLGLWSAGPDRLSPVRLTVFALNACAGTLFLARSRTEEEAPLGLIVASLPSMVLAALALKLAPAPGLWPVGAQAAFAAGGLVAVIALGSLGRSFAVFPAVRAVVGRGPYRFIRHPAYAGELAMVVSAGAAIGPVPALGFGVLALAFVVARILAEERLLLGGPAYREYAGTVRWRLMPGVW
ncbi:MAG: methyltransferase family protein [Myxococcaceae bacterium]